uniref:Glial cell line-derived neurotrophic factor n=1 Tax=Electrophorus electricus TaxID=8005 RepID=A0A4W4F784_ELEEL
MKLWDVLATCFLLLSSTSVRPVFPRPHLKRTPQPALRAEPLTHHPYSQLSSTSTGWSYDIDGLDPEQFDDVMDFIEAAIGRLRRSPEEDSSSEAKRSKGRQKGAVNAERGNRGRAERKRIRGRGGGRLSKGVREELVKGQGRGCLLKEIHLNVTDLGLGYQTKEELIFRYCSGPCHDSETNYDKILNNLSHNRKLDKELPSQTCCRPVAFDDDLSFLDDNLEYHTLKKHSAKKCACV